MSLHSYPIYDSHRDRLLSDHQELLRSGKYSDLTLKCGNKTWHVHRFILCAWSKVFAAASDGYFQEATTHLIDLKDDDPDVIEQLLNFMYRLDYDDRRYPTGEEIESFLSARFIAEESSENSAANQAASGTREDDKVLKTDDTFPPKALMAHKSLMMNVQIYAAAEKYDIELLKEMSQCKFERLAFWLPRWSFPSILHEILTTTPSSDRGLRDTALNICIEQVVLDSLAKPEGSADWESVLKDDPDFMMEVFKKTIAKSITAEARHTEYGEELQKRANYWKAFTAAKAERVTGLKSQISDFQDNIDFLLRHLTVVSNGCICRSCGGNFNPYFVPQGAEHTITGGSLRCGSCGISFLIENNTT
ncbi:MAG: hypothetical protein Q9191_002489 [Dirinaria sp. TL-2023a]